MDIDEIDPAWNYFALGQASAETSYYDGDGYGYETSD